MKNFLSLLALVLFAAIFSTTANAQSATMDKMDKMDAKHGETMMADKADYTVIKLSQSEGVYNTESLTLAPGKYVFEVTNLEVDKGLGFYLQDATEAQVANSGVAALVEKGKTQRTGVVTLTEGTYQYSCPLNPTPHYTLTVK
ncbi:cupredoxin domain-containing protein [Lewinella sp. 4G2]|uniref:cupredoxin domain-containing protein n=1 Tax=Lewinella sp. 4G2 TaxID=1803372 RepID=UPI0007B48DE0|nr:cupredoxin domain-containing protein [Lewinella sp. 4G2]OAV43227.1 hypothetical protein A3850_001375 [Lewinella sp. 4G2]